MLPLLLMLQDHSRVADAMAEYRERTRAVVSCRRDTDEILVCAAREADRYRLPMTPSYNGPEAALVREGRLLDTAPPPSGEGAFLVRCGGVGVGVGIGLGSGRVRYVPRPLAP